MSNNRPSIVKLCNKTGKWVLIGASMGSSAVAAISLPFADVPNRIVSMIRSVRDTLESNRELADNLVEYVRTCKQQLGVIMHNLNHGDHPDGFETTAIPFLEKILDGFFHILDAISFRCEKWTNKDLPKRLWDSDKYAKELTALEEKLDRYIPILQCGVSVVTHQTMRHSIMEINGRIEEIVRTVYEESRAFAEDVKHVLANHAEKIEILRDELAKQCASLSETIDSVSDDSAKNAAKHSEESHAVTAELNNLRDESANLSEDLHAVKAQLK